VHGKSKIIGTEEGEAGEEQSQEHAHIFFFKSRRLFTENSPWQAKQLLPHTTVKFYGDCVKMCKDFAANFADKRTGCCITTTHRLTLAIAGGAEHPHRTQLTGCI
jgi:hypothetical protein